MKRTFFKPVVAAMIATILASCGSSGPVITSTPIQNSESQSEKNVALTEAEQKGWETKDLATDTIPGMSVEKAYKEIIKDYKGKTVIVSVVDSGVDIEHEDLKNVLWTNEDEIPNNGIDDDKNGYIDDIHGWNFLGDAVGENLEFVRILKTLKPKFEKIGETEIKEADKADFALYQKALAEYNKKTEEATQRADYYKQLNQRLDNSIATVEEKLGKKDFSKEELMAIEADSIVEVQQAKMFLAQVMTNAGEDLSAVKEQLQGGIDYYSGQMETHLNLDFNGRKTGDNVNDLSDAVYGNNDVDGPTEDKEDALHGTHVAGIIAAERNNGIGMNGVANNVKIMAVRAVPDGDEYDKDIALAIRYAVDNGAKVINTSFGKYYSPHADWVNDAIKYAAKHDVLIVNAAGNDSKDLDENRVYPNDQWPGNEVEIADNVLTIGALNYEYGKGLVAGFSNYGKKNIDIFSPGVQIWATIPNNEYKFLQGTSMASPEAAGVAAMIRSLYPKLSASQVKEAIMKSGLTITQDVVVGGDPNDVRPFSELSVSGKIVNMYNALIMASKM